MKKTLLLLACLGIVITSNAQLQVDYVGNTIAGANDFSSQYYIKLGASSTKASGNNIALAGNSVITTAPGASASISCGVHGRANSVNCSMTYGVAGDLPNACPSGAGVIGSTGTILGYLVGGKYAGYFYGNTYVNGTLTATQVLQSSDKRLKDNIIPLRSDESRTLDKLLDMNIVSFNYLPEKFIHNIPDSVSEEDMVKNLGIDPEKKHFGVIAQELQSLYPELVEEGQDGYLKVNYIELVPLLIRSIQELKAEVDELKGAGGAIKNLSRSSELSSPSETNVDLQQAQTRYSLNINGQTVGIKRVK